jgi:hypothetical protein
MHDTHVPGRYPKQYPFAQSAFTAHCFWSPHGGHDPPQSTSVSVPFQTPSVHEGAAHTPAVQTLSLQSTFVAQPLLVAHLVGQGPPQSTSLSPPSCKPSTQVAGTQWPLPSHVVPPSSVHVSPFWETTMAHLFETHAYAEHVVPVEGQSLADAHSTHVPLPSHTLPPFSAHELPALACVVTHVFAREHAIVAQTVPVGGQSAVTMQPTQLP